MIEVQKFYILGPQKKKKSDIYTSPGPGLLVIFSITNEQKQKTSSRTSYRGQAKPYYTYVVKFFFKTMQNYIQIFSLPLCSPLPTMGWF